MQHHFRLWHSSDESWRGSSSMAVTISRTQFVFSMSFSEGLLPPSRPFPMILSGSALCIPAIDGMGYNRPRALSARQQSTVWPNANQPDTGRQTRQGSGGSLAMERVMTLRRATMIAALAILAVITRISRRVAVVAPATARFSRGPRLILTRRTKWVVSPRLYQPASLSHLRRRLSRHFHRSIPCLERGGSTSNNQNSAHARRPRA
jgi:hypothetical protein